jgi:hypothetical protein
MEQNITTTATVLRKFLSTGIQINWNPDTNDGGITFGLSEFIYIDGELSQIVVRTPLVTTIGEMAAKIFMVPLPDGSSTPVPGGLVMLTFKTAFDELLAAAPE